MPWKVVATKLPKLNPFRGDYFPRKFHYKTDAETCLTELTKAGGEGRVVKIINDAYVKPKDPFVSDTMPAWRRK